jgi:hypothetical protein
MNTKKGQFEPADVGKLIEKHFRCHSKITTELEKGNQRVWLL